MPGSKRMITIIGGGLSGTLVAVEILRLTPPEPIHVRLIERDPVIGPGVAYRTRDPRHTLNVRTQAMSMDPRDPDHLLRWLRGPGSPHAKTWNTSPDPNGFIPRGLYAEYVKDTLERAAERPGEGVTLERLPGCHAVAVEARGESRFVVLEDGRRLESDAIVLALGNPPPSSPTPQILPFYESPRYVGDPWADGVLDDMGAHERVLIVGTNLTMVDLVLSLASRGQHGPIDAISRHGLMSARHAGEPGPMLPPLVDDGKSPRVHHLVSAIRERSTKHGDWRPVVDSFRREVSTTWGRLPDEERRRFLTHLRPFWEVHRHRAPIEIMGEIDRMRSDGKLRVRAARIRGMEEREDGVTVRIQPRGASSIEEIVVDRVINATGPRSDYYRITDDPLPGALHAAGLLRPGPLDMGFDATPEGALLDAAGAPSPSLFTLGPPLRGVLWETTAVPEIREQARALAERLVHVVPDRP